MFSVFSYPPKIGPPIQSFTLTLYWTIIPKFSRCDGSAILEMFLEQKKKLKRKTNDEKLTLNKTDRPSRKPIETNKKSAQLHERFRFQMKLFRSFFLNDIIIKWNKKKWETDNNGQQAGITTSKSIHHAKSFLLFIFFFLHFGDKPKFSIN